MTATVMIVCSSVVSRKKRGQGEIESVVNSHEITSNA